MTPAIIRVLAVMLSVGALELTSPCARAYACADAEPSHARYTDHEPAGDFVPDALVGTFDGGIAVHDLTGALRPWNVGLRLRYFGPRPLTQDGGVNSRSATLVYVDVGDDIGSRWRLGLNAFNRLNTHASDIDYYCLSRLPGEPLAGVK